MDGNSERRESDVCVEKAVVQNKCITFVIKGTRARQESGDGRPRQHALVWHGRQESVGTGIHSLEK